MRDAQTIVVPIDSGAAALALRKVTDASGALKVSSSAIDSGEREYAPGLFGVTVTASGDTTVYDGNIAAPGKLYRIHSTYAVPVVRGVEDPPVITIKVLNAANVLLFSPYVVAAVSKRKLITCPANSKVVVNLDIPGRVPVTLDIEVVP